MTALSTPIGKISKSLLAGLFTWLLISAFGSALAAEGGVARGDTSYKRIAFSNSYACNAGTVVVILASKVNDAYVHEVNYDWSEMGRTEIEYIAERLGGKGT